MRLSLPVAAIALAVVIIALTSSDGSGQTAAQGPPPAAVMIVVDEFTTDALLGPDGNIDKVRYPNFAALAASSTWFRNAVSYYDSTPKAIPMMLDGKRPKNGQSGTAKDHPRSIFDVFARRGYRIVASEEATGICPPRHCGRGAGRRPRILKNLACCRKERFDRWVSRIRSGRRTFYMKHFLMPHGPYQYLPSGKRNRDGFRDMHPGMNGPRGFHDRFLTRHNYQRYLLQIGFLDHQLGKVLRQLKREGIYDQSMIALVADHGFAWELNVRDRRRVNRRNIDEITPVPFFIKAPGQTRGRVNRGYVRTLDIVATIADAVNFRIGYRQHGRSGFSRATQRRRVVRLPNRAITRTVSISGGALQRRRRANLRRKLSLFGSGDWSRLFRFGRNSNLIGRRAADLRPGAQGRVGVRIFNRRGIHNVRPSSRLSPSQLAGTIRGAKRGSKRDIVVAVNGVIHAAGRTFYLRRTRTQRWAVMVPESAFRSGRNSVQVYEVGRKQRLRLLGGV